MKFKNFFGHLKTVLKHKWIVFKLSIKAGIPIRGFFHDMSKFSYIEFSESVKYYQGGKKSPLGKAREEIGYSKAWLHHKGRNKHHFEYWYDTESKEPPVMPLKYTLELVCDKLAASIVYEGKNWTKESELFFWNNRDRSRVTANQKMQDFLTEVFTEVSKKRNKPSYYKKEFNKNI